MSPLIGVWVGDVGKSLGQICIILVLLCLAPPVFQSCIFTFLLEILAYFCDFSLNQVFRILNSRVDAIVK